MRDTPNTAGADQSEEGQRSQSRKVRILAFLLASTLLVSIPILLILLYGRIQSLGRVEYEKYTNLAEADISREGGHLVPNMDVLAHGQRQNRPVRWVTEISTKALITVNISNPAAPSFVSQYNLSGNLWELKVDGEYAYVALAPPLDRCGCGASRNGVAWRPKGTPDPARKPA